MKIYLSVRLTQATDPDYRSFCWLGDAPELPSWDAGRGTPRVPGLLRHRGELCLCLFPSRKTRSGNVESSECSVALSA
jgi:hypothetical protein